MEEKIMKRFTMIFGLVVLSVLVAGSVMALPTNTPGYQWVNAPYWHTTDLTTAVEGESTFVLKFEEAAYESDFGLFTQAGQKLEVFNFLAEPGVEDVSVYFKQENGNWLVGLDKNNITTIWAQDFGFYFDVHTGGAGDPTADYTFYSDSALNTMDAGIQHVATEWNGVSMVNIYLDDQLMNINPDGDWNDMKVKGIDLAPVPEPTTLLLLGTGLLSVFAIARKKVK
jgi:hypothetical protein